MTFSSDEYDGLINTELYEQRRQELSDADGDGVSSFDGDCDDADASVHPGADELCDDVDHDCDGSDTDDAVDASMWWADGDGDGYGSNMVDPLVACTQPAGRVDNDLDCDDSDAGLNPAASEEPYDGIDQDCSGADLTDVDGDGYDADVVGGDDCDDEDPDFNPGVTDICYDGLDQDCAGNDDDDCDADGRLAESKGGDDCNDSDETVYPGAPEGWHDLGTDNDCDGVLQEDVTLDLADADVIIDPPKGTELFGHDAGLLDDVDGDTWSDLYIAAPFATGAGTWSGAIFLLDGHDVAKPGSLVLGEDAPRLEGHTSDALLGAMRLHGDQDGDGLTDYAASAPGGGAGGAVYLISGADLQAVGGPVDVEDVASGALTGGESDLLGTSVVGDMDVTGDGVANDDYSSPPATTISPHVEARR